jgi:Frag1/DRAM/Sfk1 family
MQYQFAGTDPQGRLIYEPVTQEISSAPQVAQYVPQQVSHACSCGGCGVQKPKKNFSSWFSQWFVMEDGVISVSLKNMTILFALTITGALVAMLVASCNDGKGDYICTFKEWPMVSDVIVQEMYNRTFILLTAIFMFGVQQVNLRAFYKQLYGKISNGRNDTMMYIGLASMVALPMVGIFDEHMWKTMHGISAGVFFGGFMIYARLLGNAIYEVRDQFPAEEQSAIKSIHNNITGLVLTTLAFVVSLALKGSGGLTAILEWATVFYFVNFFSIASFANPYYDSVHEPGKLVPAAPKKEAI